MAEKKGSKENTIRSFPDPLAPEDEKNKQEYGLSVGRAIWGEANGNGFSYYNWRKRVVDLRNAASDTQQINRYKDQDAIKEGNTSMQNQNFSLSTVIPNLVNISSNKLIDRGYEVDIQARDRDSQDEFDTEQKRRLGQVRLRDAAKKLLENGQDSKIVQSVLSETKNAPDTEDDVVWDMKLNYKTEVEESYEAATKFVWDNNRIEEVEKVIARDLHVIQRAGSMVYLDENGDIRVDSIDPKNVITGYCTNWDFSDARYVGVVREMKLSEVKAMSNGIFSDEDYYNMAKNWTSDYGNDRFTLGSYYDSNFNLTDFADFKVLVLFYQIKLPNTLVFREKVSRKGNSIQYDRVKDTYSEFYTDKDGTEKRKRGVTKVDRKEVIDIYQGFLVCNTKYSWGWEKKPNQTRKVKGGVYSTDTDFDIILYSPHMQDMTAKSMVERMSAIVEDMTLIDNKMRQLVIRSRPSGVVLDVGAIQGLSMGTGNGFITYQDSERIFNDVGNLYINTVRADGQPSIAANSPVVQELPNGLGRGLNELMALWNQRMMQIYQITGLNPAVDGTMPSKGTLVGTIQAQEMSYNAAVKHYFDAYANIMRRTAERITSLIQTQMDFKDKVEGYKMGIGSGRVVLIESTKKLKLAELGIDVRFRPTAGEKAEFLDMLNHSIKTGQIGVGDALRAKEMVNVSVKDASEYLARKIEEFQKFNSEQQIKQSQAQAQADMAASKAKSDSEMLITQASTRGKIAELNEEYDRKERLEKLKHKLALKKAAADTENKKELIRVSAENEPESEPNKGDGFRIKDAARKLKENVAGVGVSQPRVGVEPSNDVQQSLSAAKS